MKIIHQELIEQQLSKLPGLVSAQSRREFTFPELVTAWMLATEDALARFRLPEVAKISTLRSRALSSGLPQPGETRKQSRQREWAMVSQVLEEAGDLLQARLDQIQAHLEAYRPKMIELVTTAELLGMFRPIDPTDVVVAWSMMMKDDRTRGIATFLSTALSRADRQYLYQESISSLLDASSGQDVPMLEAAPPPQGGGRVEYFKDRAGEWRWRFRDQRGEIRAVSTRSEPSLGAAQKVITLLRNLGRHPIHGEGAGYRIYRDAKGHFRWSLVNERNETLAHSGEGHDSLEVCRAEVSLLRALWLGASEATLSEVE